MLIFTLLLLLSLNSIYAMEREKTPGQILTDNTNDSLRKSYPEQRISFNSASNQKQPPLELQDLKKALTNASFANFIIQTFPDEMDQIENMIRHEDQLEKNRVST